MYLLDLTTMIRILYTHAHTCLLRTELPIGVGASTEEPCTVSIAVVKGRLVSCTILTRDGFLSATGDAAYSVLAHAGRLNWTLTLQLTSCLLPPPSLLVKRKRETLLPQRLVELPSEQRTTWTRTQRLVFSLVNGKNSVTHIAYLLSLSTPLVEQTLAELYQMKVLILDNQEAFPFTSTTLMTQYGQHA